MCSKVDQPLAGVRVLVATTGWVLDRRPLAVVRSLAAAGARVELASDRFYGQGFYSRHCSGRVRCPSPIDERAYIDALAAIGRERRFDVLLPVSDFPTHAIARHAVELAGHFALACPAPAAIALAQDKLEVGALAGRLGIPAPRTWRPADLDEARRAFAGAGGPCVVKLARGAGSKLLSFVRNEAELERAYGRLPADPSNAVFDYDRPLLQRHVEGAVHDADALCSRGEVRAGFTKRRALTTGRGRGVTFEAELTAEPDLLDLAARLLGELRWHGPASVEFIRDQRDGTPWLLEVNPRFGGAMAAGIAAGVDLPVMACRLALEGDVARAAVSEPGLRYRWPIPLGAMHVWSSRPRRAALRGLIDPPPGTRTDLRLDDPMPHIVQTLQLIPAWIDHRLRRRARHR